MDELPSDGDAEGFPVMDDPDVETEVLVAQIVVSSNRPAECTAYPPDAPASERATSWISAQDGSFVGLDEMR